MRKIFLAPRSKETAYENFKSTITHGVERERVIPFLTETEKQILTDKTFYIWGNRESKRASWEKMNVGDVVLFYAKGVFVYSGVCLFKKHSEQFAMSLWPSATEEKGGYWNCIFFVSNLQPTNFSLEDLNELCGYEMHAVQGFMPIVDKGVEAIEYRYGDLDKFLEAISIGISASESESIFQIGSSEVASPKKLERLDVLIAKSGSLDGLIAEWRQKNVHKAPQEIERVIRTIERDYSLVKNLKDLYQNKCQMCGFQIKKKNGGFYSEVAHIKALSSRERGVDAIQNMLVLCPNHHKMFDYGSISFKENHELIMNGQTFTVTVKDGHSLIWPN